MTDDKIGLEKLHDLGLEWLERNLLVRINALKLSTTPTGIAMLEQLRDRLARVRVEQERRRT